jgi:hypothetical protein
MMLAQAEYSVANSALAIVRQQCSRKLMSICRRSAADKDGDQLNDR